MRSFNKVCLYRLLGPEFPVSGSKDAFYREGTCRMVDLSFAFRTKKGQSMLIAMTA